MKFASTHRRKLRKGETDWTRMDLLRFRYTRIQRSLREFTRIELMTIREIRINVMIFILPAHLEKFISFWQGQLMISPPRYRGAEFFSSCSPHLGVSAVKICRVRPLAAAVILSADFADLRRFLICGVRGHLRITPVRISLCLCASALEEFRSYQTKGISRQGVRWQYSA